MTWFSRFIPQSPRLRRLADHNHNHRARQGRRRRRMPNLENLEGRTLLSNVTATTNVATGTLTIVGDSQNDAFSITENPNGQVTVVGIGTGPSLPPVYSTQINLAPVGLPYTTPSPIQDIVVNLPGRLKQPRRRRTPGPGQGHPNWNPERHGQRDRHRISRFQRQYDDNTAH